MKTNEFVEFLNASFSHGTELYYSDPENPEQKIKFAEVVQKTTTSQLIEVGTIWTRGKINYEVIAVEPHPDMRHPETILYSVRAETKNKVNILVLMAEQMHNLGLAKETDTSLEWKVDKLALPWDGFII